MEPLEAANALAYTAGALVLDSSTLTDLDIVSTSIDGGPTLLGFLDRTCTRSGRAHLRRNLLAPASTAGDVCALQDAHRALGADASIYRNLLQRVDCDVLEDYLSSRWQLPSTRRRMTRYARMWRPSWYQQYLLDAREGRRLILALLAAAHELCDRFAATDSRLLERLGARVRSHLDTADVRQLLRLGQPNRCAVSNSSTNVRATAPEPSSLG